MTGVSGSRTRFRRFVVGAGAEVARIRFVFFLRNGGHKQLVASSVEGNHFALVRVQVMKTSLVDKIK